MEGNICTCINFKTKDNYFGRNLDLEYRFNENVIITPRNYEFEFKNGNRFKTKYEIIGMTTLINKYPLYTEASSEKGLDMARLYFPKNAHFFMEDSKFSDKICLEQYCQGMGAIGLPGDNSPTSRFVRASFNKLNFVCSDSEESSITQFFHILSTVSMVQGSTRTIENKNDITTYTCCINATKGIYYYKTYTNSQITAIKMTEKEKNMKDLSVFNLVEYQNINYVNY